MSEIKERPILFSGAMVRAILSGQKTVTRRPVKRLALQWLDDGFEPSFVADPDNAMCPYGQPGERLWVRETWRGVVKISPPDSPLELGVARYVPDRDECFRLDYAATQVRDDEPWRPSIHMPRWASRILLEITAVRVERLQDISTEQIIAEGLSTTLREQDAVDDLKMQWLKLWIDINGAESWHANPWVWVVAFKRVTP
ncbi:hypothetical protein NDO41_07945 [Ectopseudomonas mendocina]|nr:hypothetical protein NDO41_07945 [Pseudomonas mendocina]